MHGIIERLKHHTGRYIGQGLNHESEPFRGELLLEPILAGRGYSIRFTAVGANDQIFHDECSTIAPSLDGTIGLWNLNTNLPGLVEHKLRHSTRETLVFGFGDKSDSRAFREEISIDLHDDGSFGYRYAWGLPGGEFKDRSSVRMSLQAATKVEPAGGLREFIR